VRCKKLRKIERRREKSEKTLPLTSGRSAAPCAREKSGPKPAGEEEGKRALLSLLREKER